MAATKVTKVTATVATRVEDLLVPARLAHTSVTQTNVAAHRKVADATAIAAAVAVVQGMGHRLPAPPIAVAVAVVMVAPLHRVVDETAIAAAAAVAAVVAMAHRLLACLTVVVVVVTVDLHRAKRDPCLLLRQLEVMEGMIKELCSLGTVAAHPDAHLIHRPLVAATEALPHRGGSHPAVVVTAATVVLGVVVMAGDEPWLRLRYPRGVHCAASRWGTGVMSLDLQLLCTHA